jgi:pimeloyl-ACP methyl ester carboxylesterase
LILKGLLTRRDPKYYLFFTASARSRQAANDFLQRLQERRNDRDRPASPTAFLRQLKAITAWGRQPPQDLGQIPIPVLVANGDSDIMVPTPNSGDLAHRLPNATLVIYDDAGHGGIFQYHTEFVRDALAFLDN